MSASAVESKETAVPAVDADLASAEMEIDCVICMDCTGSMGSWIAAAKATAIKTAEELRASIPGSKFRLGFLGYRDHCDSDRFIHIALSEDVNAVQRQLQPVAANGGGDAPEDVAGGLNKTLNDFDWKGVVKLVLMVADAPAHGGEYNDYGSSDSYPAGDPAGLDPKVIVGQMAKRGMDFTFIKCNSSTDKMIKVLSDAFEKDRASEEQAFSVLELSSSQAGGSYYGGDFPSVSASYASASCAADMLVPCMAPPCPPGPPGGGMLPMPCPPPSAGPSFERMSEMECAAPTMAPMASMHVSRAMAMPSPAMSMSMPMSAASAPSSAVDSLHSALTSSITRSVKARVASRAAASSATSSSS